VIEIRFSDSQAKLLAPFWDHWLENYYQRRYGASWQWYWLNWQINRELLL
jgi:hypothetical protein